jgi:hypothetical protein
MQKLKDSVSTKTANISRLALSCVTKYSQSHRASLRPEVSTFRLFHETKFGCKEKMQASLP